MTASSAERLSSPRLARTAAALALAAMALPAQQDPLDPLGQDPQATQQPQGVEPIGGQVPSLDAIPGQEPVDPDGLSSTWMRPDAFQGFPVFPPDLGGYGRYPSAPTGFGAPPDQVGSLPPPALPVAPDWPAWIQRKQPGDLPYDAGTAVLVRQSDRVWLRQAGDDAFVPLYHFDTARGLLAGSDVEVRRTGEFLLLLHGGTRFASNGASDLQLVALGESEAHVAVRYLTRIELTVHLRGLRCDLPDGSWLRIEPIPEGADGAAAGAVQLVIERASEPGQYRGRATIFNAGDRPVVWNTPFGARELAPGFRVTLFLDPPAHALPRDLQLDAVEATADGARRRFRATGTGAVTWSGARFALPPAAELELDPLLGDPFAAQRPEPAPAAPTEDAPK
ncbi:MAG: hypothetical protein AB7O97_16120 [Planctomycetota bacterium]